MPEHNNHAKIIQAQLSREIEIMKINDHDDEKEALTQTNNQRKKNQCCSNIVAQSDEVKLNPSEFKRHIANVLKLWL